MAPLLQKSAAAILGALMGVLGYRAGRHRASALAVAAPPAAGPGPLPALHSPSAPAFPLGDPRLLPADVADRYRSARRAFGRCASGFEPSAMAELEELSMALWSAACCAEPFVAKDIRRLRRGTRTLCDDLGEHRRLGELAAAVGEQRGRVAPAAIDQLQSRLARRQARIRKRILARGRELYEQKPARVAHDLTTRDRRTPGPGG